MSNTDLQSGPDLHGKNSDADDEDSGLIQRFLQKIWSYIRRGNILFACWTIPFEKLDLETFTKADGLSARGFALVLIAVLTFAARGDPAAGSTEAYSAFAGGIAIVLTIILNLISRAFHVSVRRRLVISAYASTIIVMFLFVVVQQVLIYEFPVQLENLKDAGSILVSAILAGLIAFVLLLLKSKVWDKHRIGRLGILHGTTLTSGSTLIAIIVAFMSPRLFHLFEELLNKLGNLLS